MIVIRRGRPRQYVRRSVDPDELFRLMVSAQRPITSRGQGPWRPAVDVYETNEAIEIVAEVAGMTPEAFEITVEGEIVTIRGERPDPTTCEQRSFHEARIPYGAFSAEIYVPFSVEPEQASANYENGFLKITLPRTKGRTIQPTQAGAVRNEISEGSTDER